MNTKRETKITGHATEFKQENRAGVELGFISGYIATWDLDRGDFWGQRDQFVKGAFLESILEHTKKGRPIRFKDSHDRTIGGWPIDQVREDDRGLYGTAEINLDIQQGREVYSLAKQGVLSDFSIGFSADEFTIDSENNIRTITKATIWEGSIVDEPMNPYANVTEIKTVVPFQDLPLADRDREWDSTAAIGRVRDFTDSGDEPSARYKNAFLWYDREESSNFGAYKLPIADVVNGRLVAVPRAIFAAAAAIQGARGGVQIPDSDRPGVIRHLERYYAKLDMPSPFEEDEKQYFIIEEIKGMAVQDLEKLFKRTGFFSKSVCKMMAGRIVDKDDPLSATDSKDGDDPMVIPPATPEELKKLIDALNSVKTVL